MEFKLFFFITLIWIPGLSALTVVSSKNPVAVGSNVTLSLNDSITITVGSWLYGSGTVLFWYPGDTVTGSSFNEGMSFNNISYALTLTSVTLNRSGLYVLEKLSPPSSKGEFRLEVQEPVSNVSLNVSSTSLVEYNDSVTFTCSARGTPTWFSWQNGSSVVMAQGRVELSNNGQVLAINGITRYDQGPFNCIVSNNISREESTQINLNISYGPSNMTMTVLQEKMAYVSGSAISLSCSADSKPAASFYWMYNEVPLNVSGPNLILTNVTQDQTGNYTCVAQNAVTLRYASVTKTIRIVDPITSVVVNPTAGNPKENMNFSLTCDVVGPDDSIHWMKTGMYLLPDYRITFSIDNSTLYFNQLTVNDDGQYQCEASNDVSIMTSQVYNFMVNYGPWNTTITGPAVVAAGSSVTFRCSADSRPQSQFSWFFNGSKVADGSVYMTGALSPNNSGPYTCMAFNNITGSSRNASLKLTVIVPVTTVMVNEGNRQPVFNQSFTLICSASGDVGYIQWIKNNMHLLPNNIISFSNDNSTLIFNQLSFSDDGQYQCEASNAVSNMTSQAYNLMVNYGPWNTTITGPAVVAAGSSVTFRCSADSRPQSQFSWYFNGSKVADDSVYVTGALSPNNSGPYTCMAFNNITGSSSNASVKLTIKYPPRDVDVYSSQMPILNQSFTLACNYKGDVDSIQWMKNGMYLLPNNSISFSSDNSTLSFKQLTLGDDGQYQCEASNAFSNMTSQAYNLMVNYGPFNTTITGPAISETESIVAFNCSADSHPKSQYIWFFNNSKVAEGPVYMTGALLLNNSGQYTCMAFNNITGSSNNASLTLTVIESVTLNVSSSPLIPLASQDLHLFCNVNGVYSLRWLRNNQNFQPSKTVTVSEDKTTVIFKPLQTTSDNGNYQCVATNIVRQHISQPFNLVAKYGPQRVQIFLHPGITTTLTCKALSEPPAVYRWFNENNTVVGNQSSVIVPIDSILGRNYTCEAKNPLTNVTVYTSINASSDATVSVQASMLLTALLALLLPVLH
ncbi:carcinoembryonic antigen-related cell adhesion molecule 1 isoform X1 [Xyrauchen texanus]|uniref:carcinoembryonic antigen-related cell adhesion molecule 1 isoform X1 n=1 Tax=Xyrauchen texanus TaxID=154827 RepID=UPI0022428583|nr:carcinoembryonic antigen-related cell adhesion molecule 1 isoform X1 [Xyrauchen texanus]